FLNAKGAYYNTGFGLEPQGGLDGMFIIDNVHGVARGTAHERLFLRPQYTGSAELTYFTSGLGGNHELRFGGSWRRVDTTTETNYPGGGLQIRYNPTSTRARFYRSQNSKARTQFTTGY